MIIFEAIYIFGAITIFLCNSEAQPCLRTDKDKDTDPPFQDNSNSPTLPARSQVITPTFRFRCCGEVEEWRTFVSSRGGRYNVTFQVWRPTAPPLRNCYTLAGENKFTNVRPNGNEIIVSPSSSDRITFQENDVIGFDITRTGGSGGIQLLIGDSDYRNDVIWYNTFSAGSPLNGYPITCPFCIGEGELLPTSTTAAPVFSAVLSTSSCRNSQPLVSTTPSHCVLSSSQTIMTSTDISESIGEQAITSTGMASLEVKATKNTISPTTVAGFYTASEISVASKEVNVIIPQETPSPSSSLDNIPTTINSISMDLFQATAANRGSANEDQSNSSNNPWVIVAVLTVLVVTIITATIAMTLLMVTMSRKKNKNDGLANPSYGKNGNRVGHIYQTVGDRTVPRLHKVSSKLKNSGPGDGIYSLYSPPKVPTAMYTSAGVEDLTVLDKENGYNVLKPEQLPPTETSEKSDNNEEVEYAYVATTSISSQTSKPPQERSDPAGHNQDMKYSQLNAIQKDSLYWVPAKSAEELYDQISSRKYREIPRKEVTILEHLGSGHFGSVSKGIWKLNKTSLIIAVKRLRPGASSTTRVKLLQEAAIMGQFQHMNVVQLYGLVTIGEPLSMCIEYMPNGDFESYLRDFNVKSDSPPNNHKGIQYFFIQAAMDIASGMKYLSGKGFVHCDLATRNVLLSDSMTCKIGDFGMARDLVDDNYYMMSDHRAIPVKWTAPEAIFYKKYSTDSDVWSYGMVLFEIWSVGNRPFPSTELHKVPDLMKIGYCQVPPPGCPKAIYQLMVDCWNPLHNKRPNFSDIFTYLQAPVNKLLYWSPLESQSPEAEELGGNIENGKELYKDLQNTYRKNNEGNVITYY